MKREDERTPLLRRFAGTRKDERLARDAVDGKRLDLRGGLRGDEDQSEHRKLGRRRGTNVQPFHLPVMITGVPVSAQS